MLTRNSLIAGALGIVLVTALGVGGYWLYGRSEKQISSIAVMPFVNESGSADVEYLSDGMTETLISSLSQIPNLNVKARSSVFRYKGKETNPQTIGKELNVRAILNGRVVQRGNQLALSLELIDAETENVIWSDRYDRNQADLISLQTEIARDVLSKLKAKLSGADVAKVEKTYTTNPEAYQLYLKGRYFWNKRTPEGDQKSIEYFDQAIETDPNYALAFVGLADAYSSLPFVSEAPPKEAFPKAKAAAIRAIEIDDTLAEAHVSLGWARLLEWDWSGAEEELKRSIELNPNYPTAHHRYSRYLVDMGRFHEAIAEAKRAQELDPLSLIISTNVGQALLYARQYDQAIQAFRRALEIDPNFWVAHLFLGRAYEQKRMYAEAIAELQKAGDSSRGNSEVISTLGYVHAASGNRSEAQKIIDELMQLSKERYIPPFNIAIVYAGLGEKNQAFHWFDKAYEDRDKYMSFLKVDPRLDGLRSDPRFADLMRRVGFPAEANK